MRLPECVETPADLVKGRTSVIRTDADFIQSVDKERLVMPFRMVLRVEGQEVAGCNQVGLLPKLSRTRYSNAVVLPAPGSPSNT